MIVRVTILLIIALSSSCYSLAVHRRAGVGTMQSLSVGWSPVRGQSTGSSLYAADVVNGIAVNEVLLEGDSDNLKTADILSLDSIRSTLIRQEETIIFALIERAQYRRNKIVYKRGGFGDLGVPLGSTTIEEDEEELSFLEYMLVGTEVLHCGVRRYTSPEEHAFFPKRLSNGPMSALPTLDFPTDLLASCATEINFNPILLQKYVDWLVPTITENGDDEQHGSTVLADIAVLQALSRRIHYGKFVAESKYRSSPEDYHRLVDTGDADGVMVLLTDNAVEEKVLQRARLKAATYGREPIVTKDVSNTMINDAKFTVKSVAESAAEAVGDEMEMQQGKVDPTAIESIYRDFIIPLTKDVEVAYLFKRCGRKPPKEFAPNRMSRDVLYLP